MLDDLHHRLVWPREDLYWTRDRWCQCCSQMKVDSHRAASSVGDVEESAMHQLLLSPDQPLVVVVVVLQCGQVFLLNTELPYTL